MGRTGLVLDAGQGAAVRSQVELAEQPRDVEEARIIEPDTCLDGERGLTGRDHPDVADRVGSDRQQQGQLVVSRGLARASQRPEPAALREQAGEVRRQGTAGRDDGLGGRRHQPARRPAARPTPADRGQTLAREPRRPPEAGGVSTLSVRRAL